MNFKNKKNYKKSNFKGNKNHKSNSNNVKKKKSDDVKTKFQKNFRHIQRNKEAEEDLRKQNESHKKYYQKLTTTKPMSDDSDNEDELQENPFDVLVSSLSNGKSRTKNGAIDSSESEAEASESENEAASEEDDNENEASVGSAESETEELGGDKENDSSANEENGDDQSDGSAEQGSDDEQSVKSQDEEEAEIEKESEAVSDADSDDDAIQSEENDLADSEEELNGQQSDDNEDSPKGILDPFNKHLDNDLSSELLESVTEVPQLSNSEQLNWPELGQLFCQIPIEKGEKNKVAKRQKLCLDSDESYAAVGEPPQLIDHKSLDLDGCAIKTQIQPNIASANQENLSGHKTSKHLTALQTEVFSIANNYQDFYYPQRNLDNGEEIRFAYCLHALNHVLKTRTKVVHHNATLSKLSAKDKSAGIPDFCRDQGLVRPKVLILLPFRDSALRVVNLLIQLLSPQIGNRVMNHKRYLEEFGGNSFIFSQKHPKPEDFEQTFAGNTDDNFRLGISFTKKCMKLYSDYYNSDIIIASPLGLRLTIGAEGDEERDYDFLASIELLILDQTELFFMQNWDHVLHVFDHLHLQPQTTRNTDFSRVRTWCINGWSRFYRQTLLFAAQDLPEIRSLLNTRCFNYRGKIRSTNPIIGGSIRHVAIQIPQIFHRIDVTSIQSSFDTRFDYFIRTILPQCKNPGMAHCLIFVPSYFDFVRLRNYFKKEELNFVQVCEYSKEGKVARARDMFYHSAAHFLLFTERQHFFKRSTLKGIRHIVFYQPPLFPNFYSEMLNLMQDTYQNPRDGCDKHAMTCTVLYTKYDLQRLAALVGSEKTTKMARASKSTHMFMNENRS